MSEVERLRQEVASGEALGKLAGLGGETREARGRIKRVAASPFTVLIQGEPGAGKEIVRARSTRTARAAHARSWPSIAARCRTA